MGMEYGNKLPSEDGLNPQENNYGTTTEINRITEALGATIYVEAVDSISPLLGTDSEFKCTGVNDELVIQKALDKLLSGGKLLLSDGTFNIHDRLIQPSNTVISGQHGGTILKAHTDLDGNYCMLGDVAIPSGNEITYNAKVENFVVDMNGVHTSHGIWYRFVHDGIMDGIYCKNSDNLTAPQPQLPRGSALDIGAACERGVVRNCIGHSNNNTQGSIGNNSTKGLILGCTSIESYMGIFGESGTNITACVVQGGATTIRGITLEGGGVINDCSVYDVTDNNGSGIYLENTFADDQPIANNNLIRNCFWGINMASNDATAKGNYIRECSRGINNSATGAVRCNIIDNILLDNDRGIDVRQDDANIRGNVVRDTRAVPIMDYAIQFVGNIGLVIQNNVVSDYQTGGIVLNSGATATSNVNNVE